VLAILYDGSVVVGTEVGSFVVPASPVKREVKTFDTTTKGGDALSELKPLNDRLSRSGPHVPKTPSAPAAL